MWDSWWAKCHCGRFLSKGFGLHLSVCFEQCSMCTFMIILLNVQAGKPGKCRKKWKSFVSKIFYLVPPVRSPSPYLQFQKLSWLQLACTENGGRAMHGNLRISEFPSHFPLFWSLILHYSFPLTSLPTLPYSIPKSEGNSCNLHICLKNNSTPVRIQTRIYTCTHTHTHIYMFRYRICKCLKHFSMYWTIDETSWAIFSLAIISVLFTSKLSSEIHKFKKNRLLSEINKYHRKKAFG